MKKPPETLREVPGLYGPFRMSERLLQKIWANGDFRADELRAEEGPGLKILSPGKWNLSEEGPDFRAARLELDGKPIVGDVEMHFRVSDWRNHGHHENPAFKRVALHVVLFPPSAGERKAPATVFSGFRPPTLVLLPLLHESLEEYAERDAMKALSSPHVHEAFADWLELPLQERGSKLLALARERWERKLKAARRRLKAPAATWPEACHQVVMEILGYRRNRTPMANLAQRHSLAKLVAKGGHADALYLEEASAWKLNAVRPANHPKIRLNQYLNLVQKRPEWPERLAAVEPFHSKQENPSRKALKLRTLKQLLSEDVLANQLGGTRLDTLITDGFLPLLAARSNNDLFPHWRHWYPGDAPLQLKTFLKQIELITPRGPEHCSNGLLQGALQLFINRESL